MKKYFVVYCSFPYTSDPKGNTRKVTKYAKTIYGASDDVVLLIPHYVFDALLGFPVGYNAGHDWVAEAELALIAKCDLFAYDPENVSAGVIWERAFARFMGIPVVTYQELAGGKRSE